MCVYIYVYIQTHTHTHVCNCVFLKLKVKLLFISRPDSCECVDFTVRPSIRLSACCSSGSASHLSANSWIIQRGPIRMDASTPELNMSSNLCRKWELICRETRRRRRSTRCEVTQPSRLQEIAVKTHEILMCNKDIIRSQMFFVSDKRYEAVRGTLLSPDVPTGQSGGFLPIHLRTPPSPLGWMD